MKVVMVKNHCYGSHSLSPGEEADFPDPLADILVKIGIAKQVISEKPLKRVRVSLPAE